LKVRRRQPLAKNLRAWIQPVWVDMTFMWKQKKHLRFVQDAVPVLNSPWIIDFMLMQCMYVSYMQPHESRGLSPVRNITFYYDSTSSLPRHNDDSIRTFASGLQDTTVMWCLRINHEKSYCKVSRGALGIFVHFAAVRRRTVSDAGKALFGNKTGKTAPDVREPGRQITVRGSTRRLKIFWSYGSAPKIELYLINVSGATKSSPTVDLIGRIEASGRLSDDHLPILLSADVFDSFISSLHPSLLFL
jgi:hypothetical protein